MSNLITQKVTMSSKEIAELTGKDLAFKRNAGHS